ncbi:MAG: hypothetical protein MJZ36_10645 [Bacteroidaceae bacterium]|nr:hypothetical protein [Bacteroidaceae bacterium]
MIITRFILTAILLTIVFTALILIPLIKNPVWWIHDFPQDIQDEYFKTHERIPSAFFSKTVLLKKALGLIVALTLLVGIVWWIGAQSFLEAFVIIYGLWTIINWYDCFILDWIFFANIKAVRLPGTEHMDKAYHQKKYHFIRALYGMIIGLLPSLLGAALYTLFIS